MKIQTRLTEAEVQECLGRSKDDGDMPADIVFDVFGTVGSRSHPHAFEVHLATAQNDTRADSVKRKASSMAGGGGLKYAATYDEWGYFLAELFAADPEARAGRYKSRDHFHASTGYAYAMRDEMPEDTSPSDPEPYRADPDTTPASSAHVCTRHCGSAYHPDAETVRIIEQQEQAARGVAGPAADPAVFGPAY